MITLHRSWCDFVGLPDQLNLLAYPNPATGLAEAPKSLCYDVAPGAVLTPPEFDDWYAYVTSRAAPTQPRLCEFVADMYNRTFLREYLKGDVGYFRKQYPTTYEWRLMKLQLWFPVPEPGEFPGLTFNGASLTIAARAWRAPVENDSLTVTLTGGDSDGAASLAFAAGLCPHCGERGAYNLSTAVCSTHGAYT